MSATSPDRGPIAPRAPVLEGSAVAGRWDAAAVYRFGRFSALSFSLMLPLLGAATVSPALPGRVLAGLALVACVFHVFAYVLNDVIDLPLDRTEPLRADSPLVRGLIRPAHALVVALCQVPVALALHAWLQGPAGAAAALVTGMVLMAAYNLYGKRLPVPPLADAVQALGWAALALYGALMSGGQPGALTWLFAGLVFVYVLMINGIHGGLRDLANDLRFGARTTAIGLGARVADGRVVVSNVLVIYALLLQALLFGLSLLCLLQQRPAGGRLAGHVTLWSIVGAHAALLVLARLAVRAADSRPDLIWAGVVHLIVALASIGLPFVLYLDRGVALAVLAAYAVPVLVMWRHDGFRWS